MSDEKLPVGSRWLNDSTGIEYRIDGLLSADVDYSVTATFPDRSRVSGGGLPASFILRHCTRLDVPPEPPVCGYEWTNCAGERFACVREKGHGSPNAHWSAEIKEKAAPPPPPAPYRCAPGCTPAAPCWGQNGGFGGCPAWKEDEVEAWETWGGRQTGIATDLRPARDRPWEGSYSGLGALAAPFVMRGRR